MPDHLVPLSSSNVPSDTRRNPSSPAPNCIHRVLIVGSGWVGRQVAAKLASHGVLVGLTDKDASAIADAAAWIEQNNKCWLENVTQLPPLSELTRQQLDHWHPDLAIESVPEQLSLKKRVLRTISQLVAEDCIIASNASYFVPSVTCQFVDGPERFAHFHFHVPVLRDSVVDIVGCSRTRPHVLEQLAELSRRIGQYPILLRHEHPGYVYNWLLQSVLKAALELVAQDVVDFAEVDRAWMKVTGMPKGPFGIMDHIGLDVIEQVLSNARWAQPPEVHDSQLLAVLRSLTEKGKLGTKSGAGFYDYEQPS